MKTTKKDKNTSPAADEFEAVQDFESGLKRLENVVKGLETGEIQLENAVTLYREGLYLLLNCQERLDKAQNDISILTAKGFSKFAGSKQDLGAEFEQIAEPESKY